MNGLIDFERKFGVPFVTRLEGLWAMFLQWSVRVYGQCFCNVGDLIMTRLKGLWAEFIHHCAKVFGQRFLQKSLRKR